MSNVDLVMSEFQEISVMLYLRQIMFYFSRNELDPAAWYTSDHGTISRRIDPYGGPTE